MVFKYFYNPFNNSFQNSVNNLNQNKFLIGISLLILNLGSRHLIIDLSHTAQQLLKLQIIRRFTMFCVLFIGTRDVIISILLTSAFIIFSNGLFNENSKYCILPKAVKSLPSINITDEEFQKAQEIIKQYNKQPKLQLENEIILDNKKQKYYEMKTILSQLN